MTDVFVFSTLTTFMPSWRVDFQLCCMLARVGYNARRAGQDNLLPLYSWCARIVMPDHRCASRGDAWMPVQFGLTAFPCFVYVIFFWYFPLDGTGEEKKKKFDINILCIVLARSAFPFRFRPGSC